MSRSKTILVSEWFNGALGCIGIVVIQNEVGTRKAYLGAGWGDDQSVDERRIVELGTPVMASQLASVLRHLEAHIAPARDYAESLEDEQEQ